MRVVAGDLRGRRIEAPESQSTRPTTDKVREAVFNALGSLDAVEDAVVVDLFAGTGAMGIEALSRGARRCIFFETDRAALSVLKRNLETLGLTERSEVRPVDAVSSSAKVAGANLVIADPPYGFRDWATLLRQWVADTVVLESDREIGDLEGWRTVRAKRYGRTHVSFLRPDVDADGTVGDE